MHRQSKGFYFLTAWIKSKSYSKWVKNEAIVSFNRFHNTLCLTSACMSKKCSRFYVEKIKGTMKGEKDSSGYALCLKKTQLQPG